MCSFINKCVEWEYDSIFTLICRADYVYLMIWLLYRSLLQVKIIGNFLFLSILGGAYCLQQQPSACSVVLGLNNIHQPIDTVVWPHMCGFKLPLNRGVYSDNLKKCHSLFSFWGKISFDGICSDKRVLCVSRVFHVYNL